MQIAYDTRKDLPCEALHELFAAVGWSDGTITPSMLDNFNVPFIHSTLVVSAWAEGKLVGCVRALSDGCSGPSYMIWPLCRSFRTGGSEKSW